jgi:hypothetical protein
MDPASIRHPALVDDEGDPDCNYCDLPVGHELHFAVWEVCRDCGGDGTVTRPGCPFCIPRLKIVKARP